MIRGKKHRIRCFALAALLAFPACLFLLDRIFPPPPLEPVNDAQTCFAQVVLARDGTLLRAFPDQDHIWRYPVKPANVSPYYLAALIQYEDRYFYKHPGINPIAFGRAAWQWLKNGHIVSGASTLTMQVARLLEAQPRTVRGKIRQSLRALQLERRYSKREILTYYINHAPMGGVLQGVEAASRGYLGKPSAMLTPAEAALLAVLPQSPSRLRPDRFPKEAQTARDKLLARMSGVWSEKTIKEAKEEPVYSLSLRSPLLAPLLAERLHQSNPQSECLTTTIDTNMQTTVENLVRSRVGRLPPKVSLAVMVMDLESGEVRAHVGSADFFDPSRFSHVDMTRAPRSPGSTLKPFLYGMALDDGLIHSESLLSDVPRSFKGYQPGNFQQSFNGPVSVSEALTRSLNVPAVEVLDQLGPTRFTARLRQGGIRLTLPRGAQPNLSLILGGAATSLEDLMSAYSALARQGLAVRPRYTPGSPLEERRLLSPGAAFIIRDILESGGTMEKRLGTRPGARQGVAWKTGTSFGFRDAWSLGVSDKLGIGVWVGRPDGTPNPGFFGANVAAPLLLDLFFALNPEKPRPRIPPPSVSLGEICWPLGLAPQGPNDASCRERRSAWLLNSTAPPSFPDPLYQGKLRFSYFTDASGQNRVRPGCGERDDNMRLVQTVRWPALLEPWLSPEQKRLSMPPAWKKGCAPAGEAGRRLIIAGLQNESILLRLPGGSAPLVRLMARGAEGDVFWLIDGKLRARSRADESCALRFDEPGSHDLTALDEQGAWDRIHLTVH